MGYLRILRRPPEVVRPMAVTDWLSVWSLWLTVRPVATEAWRGFVEVVRARIGLCRGQDRGDTMCILTRRAKRDVDRVADIVSV